METYNGQVRTPTDAIILFEACRLGLLPRVQRRLSEKERQSIRSGSVFVWDEREAGMRRWTDGKSWSASRVSGSFLTYREMEGKRGGSNFVTSANNRGGAKTPDSGRNSAEDAGLDGEEGPDGYRYKPDGLMKQSFSITTQQGQHLHLISYYSRSSPAAQVMRQPSNDPSLHQIQIPKGMYPESTINDQSNTPAVTRSPMPGAPNYAMAPSPTYARPPPHAYPYYPGYMPHPAYAYPISPMHTPPGYPLHPYAHPAGLPPMGHPGPAYGAPPPPPPGHLGQAPPSAYDQRPLRNSLSGSNGPSQSASTHTRGVPTPNGLPPPRSPLSQNGSQNQAESGYASAPQIDPRLTDESIPANNATLPARSEEQYLGAPYSGSGTTPTTASHAPTIGALMNETDASSTRSPVAADTRKAVDKDGERQGSRSPGGTKSSVPPQDIPNEKLGFREDMRALSKLDRVFTRV